MNVEMIVLLRWIGGLISREGEEGRRVVNSSTRGGKKKLGMHGYGG